MAQTGVTVADAVIAQFTDMKLGRVQCQYIIYAIVEGSIVTEKVGAEKSASFESFVDSLPADDCRYAVYDMSFTTKDGRPANKLVSISWAPDTAKITSKMVYAGSKGALTQALVGVSTKITATDRSEITESIVIEACQKFA